MIVFLSTRDYVDGLIAVISTDTKAYTFEINHGVPVLLGSGDLHDVAFDDYSHSAILEGNIETGATASATFTLTVYPTKTVFDAFRTNSSWQMALGFVGAIAICTVLFILYDYLMRNEVTHRQRILDVKRKFVRFVSHEIRTPLNTVCMGLELLQSEMATEQASSATTNTSKKHNSNNSSLVSVADNEEECSTNHVIHDIQENAQLAVEILNDILNYDKIETGTLRLDIGSVPIWKLLSASVHHFQIQAANKKVDLKFKIESQLQKEGEDTLVDLESGNLRTRDAQVIGDNVRLGQAFRNIISNALKFTQPNGKIEVAASYIREGLFDAPPITVDGTDLPHELAMTRPRAGSIHVVIKDNGVGMTKSQLKTVFGEGVQFDANKLQHGGGSGLGLGIAKGVIEQHRGTISVDSDGPNCGTCFIVELPLYLTDDGTHKTVSGSDTEGVTTDEASSIVHHPIEPVDPPIEAKRHILVVEDVHSSCKMLMRLLQRSGHTCISASNGQLAIEAVKDDMAAAEANVDHVPIDCILMDYEST